MKIYCCFCKKDIKAELTDGGVIYPHRPDLKALPFWKCGACNNFVGCHHKTKDRTRPLGCIATQDIKNARKHIHKILDPIWKEKRLSRKELYKEIKYAIGHEYHTAEIRTIEDARNIYRVVQNIANNLQNQPD